MFETYKVFSQDKVRQFVLTFFDGIYFINLYLVELWATLTIFVDHHRLFENIDER